MPIKRRDDFQFGQPTLQAPMMGPQRRMDEGMPAAPANGAVSNQQPPDWMAMLMKMFGGK